MHALIEACKQKAMEAAQGDESLFLEVFKSHGDVALGDVVSEHGGDGLRLDLMILEVFYNLNDSMILPAPQTDIQVRLNESHPLIPFPGFP